MLYDNFHILFKNELEKFIQRYYESRNLSFSDYLQYLYLLKWDTKQKVNDRIQRRKQSRVITCLRQELNFVKYVLDSLDRMDKQKTLYWDLDDTLLYFSTIRPAAPLILKFLNEHNYEHGIFSNNSVSVSKIWHDSGEFISIGMYFDKEKIHYNSPPTVNVKLGDISVKDLDEEKVKNFLRLFESGILIDNSQSTRLLEHLNRGICVHQFQPKL